MSVTSDATAVYPLTLDEYEKRNYYNGITNEGDHPILVYCSDYRSRSFPRSSGRSATLPVKTMRGVFDTPLNNVWHIVGPQICTILKSFRLRQWSIDTARFFTHSSDGGNAEGTLGPVVVWIGVLPGSISFERAHEVSMEILALLRASDVNDVVVEFREAETQQLSSKPLLPHVSTADATRNARHFLTALLGVPLATQDNEETNGDGTLTLWFRENRDENGNASNKVFGLTCCHVLRQETTATYELRDGALRNEVRVCGMCRFQDGLDSLNREISDFSIFSEYYDDVGDEESKAKVENNLDALHIFRSEVKRDWSNISLQRSIGYVQFSPAITVGDNTGYTSDWGVFVADEAKVRPAFEGNVVDLGSIYTPQVFISMFQPGGQTTFRFPDEGKLRIVDCATEDDLAHPTEFDAEGQHCLMVGKDGSTTGLTVGRYAGLVSFLENEAGIVSRELAIYNAGRASPFSKKGDSGSLAWHLHGGGARMVGQLHSGRNAGQTTGNHITYATPAWYLLEQVREKYQYADFYPTEW
ncbi:hypothetical protein CYLTODRAFT_418511 [Cylindrobasidium torrendii FP15055 ss-10]|uniref:Uncharacterized protein n=1 Tax=Cylindrobasidium torrendii FP15055 ss-10 TaxID=1314674 RepID=A0A0D7BNN3_9AGAR|nr:hypothetical protein CYLTODRAFT_418511 [Cylindrobasidium torrendii FP15055 ss-10]